MQPYHHEYLEIA
jgi:hypothetical protein